MGERAVIREEARVKQAGLSFEANCFTAIGCGQCHVCETCGRPLDTLCVYKGGCVHAHHSGRGPPLRSCRVIRMSGLGDRFDALCAVGRRSLSPCWLIRMSGHGDPFDGLCVDVRGFHVRPGDPDVAPG